MKARASWNNNVAINTYHTGLLSGTKQHNAITTSNKQLAQHNGSFQAVHPDQPKQAWEAQEKHLATVADIPSNHHRLTLSNPALLPTLQLPLLILHKMARQQASWTLMAPTEVLAKYFQVCKMSWHQKRRRAMSTDMMRTIIRLLGWCYHWQLDRVSSSRSQLKRTSIQLLL